MGRHFFSWNYCGYFWTKSMYDNQPNRIESFIHMYSTTKIVLIIGAIFNFQESFMISEILEGIGNKFIFSISIIYMTRFLKKKNLLNSDQCVVSRWVHFELLRGGFTHICLAGANEVIKDWFSITMISSIPLILLLLASIFFIK